MERNTILLDNSPTISKDYEEDANILDQQINNKNIKNIAIVAKLGAGKSSVIETYLDRFRTKKKINKKDYINPDGTLNKGKYNQEKLDLKKKNKKAKKGKYVKLSLSTFNGKEYEEEEIERSILQQLLYSQNKNKLPNSKIERTNKTSVWRTLFFSIILTVFIASSILLGTELFTVNIFKNVTWLKYIFLILMITSFVYILFHCIYYKSFKKIKYKDFEIESKDGNDPNSIINKLIDEILYFFECVDIDLVIFEDLDRLHSTDIFVKLRELNTIINNSSNKRCEKITFLYAVKSEVIEDKEQRAKFFDFILSIVPIVNPSTTEEKIREIIKERNSQDKDISLTDEYIKDISLYIPDMRILKNTFNDYLITRDRIVNEKNKNRVSNEKLFTLSLYRNIFPGEYAKLEKNEGLLPILLNKRNLFEVATEELDKKNQECEAEIKYIKNENLRKFDELKYMLKGIMLKSSYRGYGSGIAIDSITTFENLDFNNIAHPIHGYKVDINTEIKRIIDDINFLRREQNIKGAADYKIEELSQEIEKNKKKKQELNALTFAELTDFLGLNKVFNNKFISEKTDFNETHDDMALLKFLKFILKNKYIDDKYPEYTHNLSSSIISQSDIEFIKQVQNGTNDFYYKIEDIDEVLKRFKRDDFKGVSIINKDILRNIDKIKDSIKRNNLINTITSLSNEALKYILDFYAESNDEDIINLIKYLINDFTLCQKIINSNLVEVKKHTIINAVMNSDVNTNDYNLEACLTNYFSAQTKLANLLRDISSERVITIFEVLQPKFRYLSNNLCIKEQLEYIISHNFYELTKENLIYALSSIGDFDNVLFCKNNQEYISNKSDTINKYINQNLNKYISNVLLDEEILNTKENSISVKKLIVDSNISNENKRALIAKFDVEIEDVSLIEDELLDNIIEFNRMIPLWENITYVYNKIGLKENLLNYIATNLNKIEHIELFDGNKKLLLELLNSDYYDDSVYDCLGKKIANQIDIREIKNEYNLIRLINLGKVDYDSSAFGILKENLNALNTYLNYFVFEVEQGVATFFTSELTSEILNSILLSDIVPNTLKQKLIIQFAKKIKILGFEDQYAKLFITNKLKINNSILFQFTESDVDKFSLITLTDIDYLEPNALAGIKRLLCSCKSTFKDLFEKGTEFKIPNSDENNKWINKLEGFNILKVSRYGKNITLKAV